MQKNDNQIAILMATYNGEKYLREQIDSLFAQTYQDWHLYVHDDGSKDDTVSIVREYIVKNPKKVTLVDYPSQGGACKNFLSMLERIEAPYYMFCDQDDVWMPEKITKAYESMKKLELQNPAIPITINTDLIVVNKDKEIIAKSFWRYQNIDTNWIKKYSDHAALQYVTGCTMLFNKKAKEIVKFHHDEATMHDSWIALSVAANNGIIMNMHESQILYRQHGNNTLGAQDAKKRTLLYRLKHANNIIALNKKHFKEMNAIRKISVCEYLSAKIRYAIHLRLSSFKPSTN